MQRSKPPLLVKPLELHATVEESLSSKELQAAGLFWRRPSPSVTVQCVDFDKYVSNEHEPRSRADGQLSAEICMLIQGKLQKDLGYISASK